MMDFGRDAGDLLGHGAHDAGVVPMHISTTAQLGPGGETNGGVVLARDLPDAPVVTLALVMAKHSGRSSTGPHSSCRPAVRSPKWRGSGGFRGRAVHDDREPRHERCEREPFGICERLDTVQHRLGQIGWRAQLLVRAERALFVGEHEIDKGSPDIDPKLVARAHSSLDPEFATRIGPSRTIPSFGRYISTVRWPLVPSAGSWSAKLTFGGSLQRV